MEHFLSGNKRVPEPVDYRSETVPLPFVSSVEELKQQATQQQQSESSKKEPAAPASAEIDISKLDIRVGVITKAWLH